MVKGFHELLPVGHVLCVQVSRLFCLLVHLIVNYVELGLKIRWQIIPGLLMLCARMANTNSDFLLCKVFGTNFQSDGNASKLPVVELEAWVMVRVVIDSGADPSLV